MSAGTTAGTVVVVNSTHAPPDHVVVLDVSSLRFRFGPGRRSVSALTVTGEHLATVTISPSDSTAEAAFSVLVAAQQTARLLRAVEGCDDPVGHGCVFYNPFTTQLAHLGTGGLVVFAPDGPWELPPAGVSGTIAPDDSGHLRLVTPAGSAAAVELDSVAVSRALAAYL